MPFDAEDVTRTKAVMGIPDEPFWAPPDLGRGVPQAGRRQRRRGALGAGPTTTTPRSPTTRGVGCGVERDRAAGLDRRAADVRAGREDRHPQGDRVGDQRHAAVPARPRLRRRRPHRQHGHEAARRERAVRRPDPGGRQIYYGIREHAMGSTMVGMAAHGGILPVGGTFFVFLDYMRPPVRLASLSQTKVVLRLHPRLGRRRRGRPDAPTDRAARHAAGDPRPARHPPGRRQRDRPGVARRRRARRADGARAQPPERRGRHRRLGRRTRRRRRARRRRRTPDLVIVGTGSEVAVCVDAAERSAERGVDGPGREHAELGPLRAAGRPHRDHGVPDRRAGAVGRGGDDVRMGALSPTTAIGIDRFGVSAPGDVVLDEARHQRRPRRRARRWSRLARRGEGVIAWTACIQLYERVRPEPVARQPQAQLPHLRAARRAPRSRHPRPHVEPDDLPEGDPGLGRLRRAVRARSPPTSTRSSHDYWAMVLADIHGALRRARRRLRRVRRRRRLRHRSRSTPISPTTSRAPIDGRTRSARAAQPPQPDGEDPGHRRGRRRRSGR